MSTVEIVIRLAVAVFVGGLLGINRDLHRKAAGVRTIGVVSLASAMLVLGAGGVSPSQPGYAAVAPVIQGIMTGIGFLGAGVIVRGEIDEQVRGLTTAAIIWMAAGFGILCGLGAWPEVIAAVVLVFVLLIVGGPAERWVYRTFKPIGRAAGTQDDWPPGPAKPK